MWIFLIIYAIFLLVFVVFSLFILYHLIRYSFGGNIVKAMTAVFLTGIIIIFVITLVFLNRADITF